MTRRVLSMNYTDNHASGKIVKVIGVGITIFCAAVLFIAGSSGARAESGIASVYAYSGGKTASGERANLTDLPLHMARWHSARRCV